MFVQMHLFYGGSSARQFCRDPTFDMEHQHGNLDPCPEICMTEISSIFPINPVWSSSCLRLWLSQWARFESIQTWLKSMSLLCRLLSDAHHEIHTIHHQDYRCHAPIASNIEKSRRLSVAQECSSSSSSSTLFFVISIVVLPGGIVIRSYGTGSPSSLLGCSSRPVSVHDMDSPFSNKLITGPVLLARWTFFSTLDSEEVAHTVIMEPATALALFAALSLKTISKAQMPVDSDDSTYHSDNLPASSTELDPVPPISLIVFRHQPSSKLHESTRSQTEIFFGASLHPAFLNQAFYHVFRFCDTQRSGSSTLSLCLGCGSSAIGFRCGAQVDGVYG